MPSHRKSVGTQRSLHYKEKPFIIYPRCPGGSYGIASSHASIYYFLRIFSPQSTFRIVEVNHVAVVFEHIHFFDSRNGIDSQSLERAL